MKRIFITLIIIFVAIGGFSQDASTTKLIKGKVIDASTKQGIAYTNIGLEGTFYGTASNDQGEFELKIPEEFQDLKIFFSAVGYQNKVYPVANMFETDFNLIRLEEQTYSINDIDISAQSKVLIRILRTASDNVNKNFITQPTTYICSYENEIKQDSASWLRKAKVKIEDQTAYSNPSKLDAFKNRNYIFTDNQKNFETYTFKDGTTHLDEIIELDFARSLSSILNPGLLSKFQLKMEDDNNNELWVIGFRQPDPTFDATGDFNAESFEGKIYINKNDYSVLKIECWVRSPKQNSFNRALATGSQTKSLISDVAYDFSISYDNKGLKFISLNKNYMSNGKSTTQHSKLMVDEIKPYSGAVKARDYFEGN